jgi:hypothetical protein
MSTAQEIENAIRALPQNERQKLIEDLPSVLPELSTSDEWLNVLNDPRPRPALSALGDSVAAEIKNDPAAYPIISEENFGSRK